MKVSTIDQVMRTPHEEDAFAGAYALWFAVH